MLLWYKKNLTPQDVLLRGNDRFSGSKMNHPNLMLIISL